MYRDHSVGVVIPSYNERGFVGDVIRGIPEYVDRIYVVDDSSTDGSWEEILEAARADEDSREDRRPQVVSASTYGPSVESRTEETVETDRVIAFRHHRNRGAGGAVKTGYFAALADELDIVATVDGDGQMDITELPRLLDPIVDRTAEYTKGNRLASAETRADMPIFRLLGNVLLSTLTKIVSGYWHVGDSQNGYTAISGEALSRVDITSLYEYYGYCNDLLVKLNVCGVRVADVPMPAVYGTETSSIGYTAYTTRVSWMLVRNFGWRLQTKYGHRPVRHALVIASIVVLTLGTGLLIGLSDVVLLEQPEWFP